MGRTKATARVSRTPSRWLRPPPPIQLPEDGFDGPFDDPPDDYHGIGPRRGKEHPRTVSGGSLCPTPCPSDFCQIVELRMCALSNRIREKSNWWEKVKDETIVERWREEALQQAEDGEQPEWKLTPGMVSLASCLPVAPAILTNPMSQGQVRTRGASGIRSSTSSRNWDRGTVQLPSYGT